MQSAVSSQTTVLPVVTLCQTDRLRVYVYLSQKDAASVHVGDPAEVSDSAGPENKLKASVTRASGELRPQYAHTADRAGFGQQRRPKYFRQFRVQVSLALKTALFVEIPADALLMKGDKAYVAVITPGNRIKIRPVSVYESDGKTVMLRSGLDEHEHIALNPGTGILDGEQVQPVPCSTRRNDLGGASRGVPPPISPMLDSYSPFMKPGQSLLLNLVPDLPEFPDPFSLGTLNIIKIT